MVFAFTPYTIYKHSHHITAVKYSTKQSQAHRTLKNTVCLFQVFVDEGIKGDVTVAEFPVDLVPIDTDLLSLELESSARELLLDKDISSLHYVARAIMRLQSVFGTIPTVKGESILFHRV